jgi:acetyl esterase/lipase
VYEFIEGAYSQLLASAASGNMILMGDSAGAGLAFGFAQKLRNEDKPLPAQIILLSPWLDVTMSNPEIAEADKKDRMLGIKGLQMAGKSYAGDQDMKHCLISPIYGDFRGLGRISLFIGTHDVLYADCRKFRQMMREQGIPLNYYEYPKMFHVWIAVTALKESRSAIGQITELVNPRL